MSKPFHVCLLAAALALALPAAHAAGGIDATSGYGMPAPAPAKTKPVKTESYGTAISNKLGAGFANILLGVVEVPKNVVNTTNDGNMALGVTLGAVKGLIHMCGRGMAGALDVLTFPLPTEPLTTPQYVWEDTKQDTRYNPLFQLK
ncbi:MAG: exosortase system-associated protein, TIGR04073 family [Candidatus Methylumidiphilus sp.]